MKKQSALTPVRRVPKKAANDPFTKSMPGAEAPKPSAKAKVKESSRQRESTPRRRADGAGRETERIIALVSAELAADVRAETGRRRMSISYAVEEALQQWLKTLS